MDAFLAVSEHPGKVVIENIRAAILNLDPRIREEVKWNAPSFMLEDHFATFKLYPQNSLQLVLHTGAKPKKPSREFVLQGSTKLVKWAAPDRCVINVGNNDSTPEHCQLVANLVQQWIRQL